MWKKMSIRLLHCVGKPRPLLTFWGNQSLRKLVPIETFYMLEEGNKNILQSMAHLRHQAF